MSKFVDERVVEMSFDNKKFESNVKTSMGTIDKLKNSLDFSGSGDSINKHLNNIDISGFSSALMSAKNSFTALEVVAIASIANITNRVIDLGIQMIKSLSVDQISSGWAKFGESAVSEATLLAQGYEQADVTAILEKLMWYSDETSYSFTDMLNNMSKFTATGAGLDDSARAMMGIANWAALSGQNAGVASRAMYQLSQAMAQGNVRLMDYKSIQNANMDTKEFRETVLETAVAFGELIPNIDGTFTTLTGKTFDTGQFTTELDELWFTSEVLMKSLDKYASGSEKIYEKIADDSSITTASEAIEKYGDDLEDFELKAFLAAQEARTFKDAIVAVKDAVSSGWLNIFTQIFGSVADAKVLWTDLANELYDVFMDGMWTKIDILSIWAENGGRDDLFANTEDNTGAFWNLFHALVAIKDLVGGAWQKVFGLSDLEEYDERIEDVANKLKVFTENLKQWSEGLFLSGETAETLTNILTGLFSILKIGGKTIIAVWNGLSPLLELIKPLLGFILEGLGLVGKEITIFSETTTVFDVITEVLQSFSNGVIKFVKSLELLKGVRIFVDAFNDSLNNLIGDTDVNAAALSGFRSIIDAISTAFKWLGDIITTYLVPNLPKAFELLGSGLGWLVGSVINLTQKIGVLLARFREWAKVNVTFQNGLDGLKRVLARISDSFKWVIDNISLFFKSFGKADMSSLDDFTKNLDQKLAPLKSLLEGLGNLFQGLWHVIKAVLPIIGALFSLIGDALTWIGDKLKEIFTDDAGEVNIKRIFSVGFLSVVAIGIYRFADMLRSITQVFRDAFDGMFDFVNSKSMMQYMEAIKTMAISILLMVGALLILGAMDVDVLKRSTIALSVLIGFIVGVMLLMKNLVAGSGVKSIIKDGPRTIKNSVEMSSNLAGLAAAFIGMGLSILLLSAALKVIAKLDPKELVIAMGTIITLMVTMGLVMYFVSKADDGKGVKKSSKSIKSMIRLAIAIALLAKPLEKIGRLDTSTIVKGVSAIGGILLVLLVFTKALTVADANKLKIITWQLIKVSIGLVMLSASLVVLDKVSKEQTAHGLLIMASAFAVLALLSKLITVTDAAKLRVLTWQLSKVSFGLVVFASSLAALSFLNNTQTITGLLTLASALAILSLMSKLITIRNVVLLDELTRQLTKVSWGLLVFASSLAALSFLNNTQTITGLLTLATTLAILVIMSKRITIRNVVLLDELTRQLTKVSWGLVAFAVSLLLLNTLSISQIGVGLGALLGVMVILVKMSKSIKAKDAKRLKDITWGLLEVSVALTAFVGSLLLLNTLSISQIGIGLGALLGALVILVKISKSMKLKDTRRLIEIAWGLLGVSAALTAFAVSLLLINTLAISQIGIGLGALLGVFIILIKMSKIVGPDDGERLLDITWGLLEVSIALTAFAVSLLILNKSTPGQMLTGLGAIAGAIFILGNMTRIVSPKQLDRLDEITWHLIVVSAGLAAFAASLLLLNMSTPANVGTGLVTIALVMGMLIGISYAMTLGAVKRLENITWHLTVVSASLAAFGASLLILGKVDPEQVGRGLSMILWTMVMLLGISYAINEGAVKRLRDITWHLIVVSAGLAVFATSLLILNKSTPGQMLTGLGAIAGAMLILVGMAKIMGFDTADELINITWHLMVVSAGLAAFAASLLILNESNFGQMITGLVAIAGIIGILVGMTKFMSVDAADELKRMTWHLIVVSAGLAVFAASLLILNKSNFGQMMSGLFAIVVVMATLVGMVKIMRWSVANELQNITWHLISVATGLAVFAAALLLLNKSSFTQMLLGLGVIAGAMLILVGMVKLMGHSTANDLINMTWHFIVVSAGLAAFAASLLILNKSNFGQMITGLIAIAGVMATLTLVSKYMKKLSPIEMIVTSSMLTLVAFGLAAFASALLLLNKSTEGQIGLGLAVVAGVMLTLGIVSKYMNKLSPVKMIVTSSILTLVAIGLAAFASALLLLNKSTVGQIGLGLAVVAGVMLTLGVVSKYMTKLSPLEMMVTSSLMTLVAIGLAAFASALLLLNKSTPGQIGLGIAAIAGVMGTLLLTSKLMNYADPAKMLAVSGMMYLLGVGLIAVAYALQEINKIGWVALGESLLKSIAVIVSIMAVIWVLSKVMTSGGNARNMLMMSVQLTLLAVGLAAFGYALQYLNEIDWPTVLKSLAIVAVVIATIAVLSLVSTKILLPMLALVAVVAIFAGGLYLLVQAMKTLSELSEVPGSAYASSIIAISEGIIEATPAIANALRALASIAIVVLTEIIPSLVDALSILINKLLWTVAALIPPILFEILPWLLIELAKGLWIWTKKLFKWIAKGIEKELVEFGLNLKQSFSSIGKVTKQAVQVIGKGIADAFWWVVNKIKDFFTWMFDGIKSFFKDFGEGMRSGWKTVTEWFDGLTSAIGAFFDDPGGLIKKAGENIIKKLREGLTNRWGDKKDGPEAFLSGKVKSLPGIFSKLWDDLKTVGKNIIEGFVEGLKETWNAIPTLLGELGSKAVKVLLDVLGIDSPSTVFAEIGKYVDLGLVKGIEDHSKAVYNATGELGNDAAEGVERSGLSKAISDLSKSLETDFDNEIVIRPVLDLSEIQNGKNQLYSMMSDVDSYDISGSNSLAARTSEDINRAAPRNRHSVERLDQDGSKVTEVINNTFNITGSNPKEIAQEVSKRLQNQVDRRKAKWAT